MATVDEAALEQNARLALQGVQAVEGVQTRHNNVSSCHKSDIHAIGEHADDADKQLLRVSQGSHGSQMDATLQLVHQMVKFFKDWDEGSLQRGTTQGVQRNAPRRLSRMTRPDQDPWTLSDHWNGMV